jgi:hypothetical protein
MPTVHIGLGPRREVTEDVLKRRVEDVCPVLEMRFRGQYAFVDVATDYDAQRVIDALNNVHIGETRLSVRGDAGPPGGGRGRDAAPRGGRGGGAAAVASPGANALFFGLGPRREVSEDDLKRQIEQVCRVVDMRFHGQYALVTVATGADAERVIEALNNVHIGETRLSVRHDAGPPGGSRGRDAGPAGGSRGYDAAPRYGGRGGGAALASPGTVSLYFGLGPRREIGEDDLKRRIEEVCRVVDMRFRGTCAFVDVASQGDASRCVAVLNGSMIGDSRLNVQMARSME